MKPLKEVEENVCSSARMCFSGGREFLEAPKPECMSYSLIPRLDRKYCTEVPIEVSGNLLTEFQNNVSDNVSGGLPSGSSNKVVDALSRRQILLTKMQSKVVGFNEFKTLYPKDPNFAEAWKACKDIVTLDRTRWLDFII